MIFNKYSVLTLFIGIFCNIPFITCNWYKPESFDDADEFEVALKLDTGCEQLVYEKVFDLGSDEMNSSIQKCNLYNRSHVIYYNLYCGNLYYFLKYMKLSEDFIPYEFSNSLCYNPFLDEGIIQSILSVILKTKLDAPLDPLWKMYMYTIYIKKEYRKKIHEKCGYLKYYSSIIQLIKEDLNAHTDQYCQEDDNYHATKLGDLSNVNRSSEITNVIDVINTRMNNNSFFLDKEENWVSLSSIYLKDIFDKSDILKTIIQIGDQTVENSDKILKDIQNAYTDARNYFWFDSWILNIYNYQTKIFNIFKVVALYLMRKHLKYLAYNKNNTTIKKCNSEMYNVLVNNVTFNNLFKCGYYDISNIISSFLKTPINYLGINKSTYNKRNFENIQNIECGIRGKFFVKSFEVLLIQVDDSNYTTLSIDKTKTFMSDIKLSKEKENNIKTFESISNIHGLNDNFLRFNIFLEYLENIFKNVNFSMIRSFMEFSSKYNQIEIEHWKGKQKEDKTYISF